MLTTIPTRCPECGDTGRVSDPFTPGHDMPCLCTDVDAVVETDPLHQAVFQLQRLARDAEVMAGASKTDAERAGRLERANAFRAAAVIVRGCAR